MERKAYTSGHLGASITKAASKQAYYTIRCFVDRERVADAYRAYGYFRWVDDVIDAESGSALSGGSSHAGPCEAMSRETSRPAVDAEARLAFVHRQKSILESCYRGGIPAGLCVEEWMLVDLVRNDTEKNSGLQSYLRNMMDVMIFDAGRREQIISHAELADYSHKLAKAVTEAMHHFIGHDDPTPRHEARYQAVTAAHIIHMLRDAHEDVRAGYFNIPGDILQAHGISPQDVDSRAYRDWVRGRVQLAREYFKAGRDCIAQIRSLRCRLAGFAYTARFEWMARTIERDDYCLRPAYPDRKSLRAGLWMVWSTITSMFALPTVKARSRSMTVQPIQIDKP